MTEKLAMTGVLLVFAASVPLGLDPKLWAEWGLAGIVVIYILWRDHSREKRMSKSIEQNHEWVRETLVDALERNTSALEKMTAKLEEQSSWLQSQR